MTKIHLAGSVLKSNSKGNGIEGTTAGKYIGTVLTADLMIERITEKPSDYEADDFEPHYIANPAFSGFGPFAFGYGEVLADPAAEAMRLLSHYGWTTDRDLAVRQAAADAAKREADRLARRAARRS